MGTIHLLVLASGMLLPGTADPPAAADCARLRELLYNRQDPRGQSQAALLLVQDPSPEAEAIVRQGLRQAQSPEVFQALAVALRVSRDPRFREELLTALSAGTPLLRESAAGTLAELTDVEVAARLKALAEDPKTDLAVRQSALRTLGRSGLQSAVPVLLGQLAGTEEALRQAAADGLSELSGQAYGPDEARWQSWWARHRDLSNERWLAERLAYQASRVRRLEGELEHSKAQIVRLHQQLYSRLPAADRFGYAQVLADHEDPSVRTLAVNWSLELLSTAEGNSQRALVDLLLRLSHDGATDVQRQAGLALGRVPDVRAFERLCVLLRHGAPPVRAAAARGLAQQARGNGPEALARRQLVVPALQKALEDPALEVLVEAAEDLGTLGVTEAGPVLLVLLRHPSPAARQTAAQALERVADPTVLDALLEALEDPAVTVRFSLVGAVGHAAGAGQTLPDAQRNRLLARLESVLVRDADPGVRSRAATVLGACGSPEVLPALWRRVLAAEDGRVHEKAWAGMVEILARSGNLDLVREWDQTLAEAKQGARRLQLWGEIYSHWQKRADAKAFAPAALEALIQVQLEQGRWAAALPLVRDQLGRPGTDAEVDKRLRWLHSAGEQALREGNLPEAQRVIEEAQPFLSRRTLWAGEFEKLQKQAARIAASGSGREDRR
jgi:HEAT repeat protein